MPINNISLNRFENNRYKKTNFRRNTNTVSFKGIPQQAYDKATTGLAKCLGKLADTQFARKFVGFLGGKNYGSKVLEKIGKTLNVKQKWFQHAVALEGILVTSCYMYNTKKSKNIPEDQKRPMMTNQALVTTLCTTLGYVVDNKITKFFNKVKHIFTVTNVTKIAEQMKDKVAAAKKVAKTAGDVSSAVKLPLKTASGISNGISKLKSVLVFGFIYRYFSPVFITPIANRVSALFEKAPSATKKQAVTNNAKTQSPLKTVVRYN